MLLVTKHNYLSFMIVEMSFFIHVENSYDFHPSNEVLWNHKAYGIIGSMRTHNDTSCYCKELSIFSQFVILFPLLHNFTQDLMNS
jgi:hypothetical protein